MMLNFADKIVVGLAGAAIMADLKLGPTQFGLLGSSFFFLFSISAVLVGFIVNRVQTRWVILCLSLVWAAVQFPMIGTVSFTTLMICRIILGAGEGPGFSVAVHAIYKWFPDAKRTLPTAILSQGAALGVVVAVPALNWAIVTYSWHYAFGALGITGVLWAVVWLIVGKEGALEAQIATSTSAEFVRVPYLRTPNIRHLYRMLLINLRPLLGSLPRPDLVHAFHCNGASLLPEGRRLDHDTSLGDRCRSRATCRLVFSVPRISWRVHSQGARHTRSRTSSRRRTNPTSDPTC